MIGLAATSLSACVTELTEKQYVYTEKSPTRYPLDFPICRAIPGIDAGEIVVPLRLRIYGAGLPDPAQVMSLRKRNPSADGCFSNPSKPSPPAMTLTDSFNGDPENLHGWMVLDQSSHGLFAASAYKNQLLNAKDLQKEQARKGAGGS
jgi:hypothetical protein